MAAEATSGVAGRVGVGDARAYLQRTLEQALGAGPELVAQVPLTHAYWLVAALTLVDGCAQARVEEVLQLVRERQNADGGFGATPGAESSALHTLAAVQVSALLDSLSGFRSDLRLVEYARAQLCAAIAEGCDARQACCATLALALLGCAPARGSEEARSVRDAILLCRNWDGAFGGVPLAESHAGTTFCCLATLSAIGELGALPRPGETARWLAERQQPCGGFNGRAGKDADLCYSWWCPASLAILEKGHWLDAHAARRFIDQCACADGGLAFAPGQAADPYHTFFGLAALALVRELGGGGAEAAAEVEVPLRSVECVFALPRSVVPMAQRIAEQVHIAGLHRTGSYE